MAPRSALDEMRDKLIAEEEDRLRKGWRSLPQWMLAGIVAAIIIGAAIGLERSIGVAG